MILCYRSSVPTLKYLMWFARFVPKRTLERLGFEFRESIEMIYLKLFKSSNIQWKVSHFWIRKCWGRSSLPHERFDGGQAGTQVAWIFSAFQAWFRWTKMVAGNCLHEQWRCCKGLALCQSVTLMFFDVRVFWLNPSGLDQSQALTLCLCRRVWDVFVSMFQFEWQNG